MDCRIGCSGAGRVCAYAGTRDGTGGSSPGCRRKRPQRSAAAAVEVQLQLRRSKPQNHSRRGSERHRGRCQRGTGPGSECYGREHSGGECFLQRAVLRRVLLPKALLRVALPRIKFLRASPQSRRRLRQASQRGEEEPAFAAAAAAGAGAEGVSTVDAVSSTTVSPEIPETAAVAHVEVTPQREAELAAAWQNWKQIRESFVSAEPSAPVAEAPVGNNYGPGRSCRSRRGRRRNRDGGRRG